MYVSRLDRFVWIERGTERPWLITPDQPEAFLAALTQPMPKWFGHTHQVEH